MMRSRVLAAVLLVAALTASVGGAPQAAGLGTIGGRVVGPDGKPVEGARVMLQSSDGSQPQTAETNAQGRFWFPWLPSGPYDLRAHAKRRASEWRHNVWVNPGRQTNVTLRLRREKPPARKAVLPPKVR